jgi:hypothetical protein
MIVFSSLFLALRNHISKGCTAISRCSETLDEGDG